MTYRSKPVVFLALAVSLAACASPSPQLMRGMKHEAEVGGSRFTIWQKGETVEIYRTSPEMMPRLSEVMAKAAIAVARVTGCPVKEGSMVGDAALMKATLDCG